MTSLNPTGAKGGAQGECSAGSELQDTSEKRRSAEQTEARVGRDCRWCSIRSLYFDPV